MLWWSCLLGVQGKVNPAVAGWWLVDILVFHIHHHVIPLLTAGTIIAVIIFKASSNTVLLFFPFSESLAAT